MSEVSDKIDQLRPCFEAYGLQVNTVEWLARGSFAEVFKLDTQEGTLVARIRAPEAKAEEVRFAHQWAVVVSPCVEVPVPLKPPTVIPTINGRCVEIAPYIEHDGSDEVGPDAWAKVGRWVGTMHRMAACVSGSAPVALDYGNHPHDELFNRYLEQARIGCRGEDNLQVMHRVDAVTERVRDVVAPHLEGLPVGVVHGDMHFWNVLYSGGQPIAIIDLDFLQRGILLHDLAYASYWLTEWTKRGGVWSDIFHRYLAAYEEGRQSPLTAGERFCLRWLTVYRGIFFFLSEARLSWTRVMHDRHDLEEAEATMLELLDE